MQDAVKFGLGRMPTIELTTATLIVSLDEALRLDTRCPLPQCHVTDNLLSKAYNPVARMAQISNSMLHLMLAPGARHQLLFQAAAQLLGCLHPRSLKKQNLL